MTQDRIRSVTDQFVAQLTQVIREEALGAVQAAIAGEASTPPRRSKAGRSSTASSNGGAPRRAKATRVSAGSKRSQAQVDAMAEQVHGLIAANPGCSATDLAAELGVTTKDVRLPIQKLLGDGKVRTEGQARGTKYFAGGGASRKKGTRKATRKTTRKKAGRKGRRKASAAA